MDILSAGLGSIADFANSYGSNYTNNQSGFDVADNGQVDASVDASSASTPSWLNLLQSAATVGTKFLPQGSNGRATVSAAPAPAPQAQATPAIMPGKAPSSKWLWLGLGAAVLAIGGLFLFRRK
jgi:hypothetical protein